MCTKGNYRLAPDFKVRMLLACHEMYEKRDEKFGNARDVRKFFERCQSRYLTRTSNMEDSNPPMVADDLDFRDKTKIEDILQGQPEFVIYCPQCNQEMLWSPDLPVSVMCPKCKCEFPSGWGLMKGSGAYNSQNKQAESKQSLPALLAELEGMTGLASVKTRIKQLIDSVKVQQLKRRRGLPAGVPISLHMIFAGSPGTGKTTVARLVGNIFHAMGLLSKGHFVEVDRSKLVGSYVGQTEKITSEKLDEAMDGILFVDEAYSLTSQNSMGNDFGQRAVETILKRMEDSRDRLVVIAAGYQDDIKQFLESNSGLASRFSTHLLFEDYTPEELLYITHYMASASKLTLEDSLRQKIFEFFIARYEQRNKTFSNARLARNLLEKICMLQTSRISHHAEALSDEDFQTLKVDDWPDDRALVGIH
jgi:Holliday junction resolvasome RuvABC ATP-dependent DNA helicase subunit